MAAARSRMFRDVGSSVAQLSGDSPDTLVPANLLIRGPMLAGVTYEQFGSPGTIVNLRVEVDDISHVAADVRQHVQLLHFPMKNKSNVYDTQSPSVRAWLAEIFRKFESPINFPILIHCKHGRDRTGVVVAILLWILGTPKEIIMQDYLLTDGARMEDMQRTFRGVTERGGVVKYFEGMLDLEAVRSHLSVQHILQTRRDAFLQAKHAVKRGVDASFSCASLLEICHRGLRLMPSDIATHAGIGWALVRLENHEHACSTLCEGLRLASLSSDVSPDIVKMMENELAAAKLAIDAKAT